MKEETYARKLAEVLGLNLEAPEVKEAITDRTRKPKDDIKGVTLEEIDQYRAANATLIFLQAPELFQPRVCLHCGETFLVSRKFVAYCTYTCLKKELDKIGIIWDEKKPLNDQWAKRVWDDNEPLNVPPLVVKILSSIIPDDPS